MPVNQTSGTSCSIFPIDHPALPAGLPASEYKHHTMKSAITGAIQEIVIIESNQGTSFEISLDIKPTAYAALHQPAHQLSLPHHAYLKEDDYLIYVLLDGINAQRSKRHRSQLTPTRISGVYSRDRSSSRSFQFGSIHLVDPDDHQPSPLTPATQICEDEKIMQALGTIQVNIVRCTLGQPKPLPQQRLPPGRGTMINNNNINNINNNRGHSQEALQTTNQMMFSERSKKACQLNTAGLSAPVPISAPGHAGGFPGKRSIRPVVREDQDPFLQFIFRYKPRAILEAEGIISPPPPPSAPPHPSASKPALPGQPKLLHDYQSNSELHKSSLNPNARGASEKPKTQARPKAHAKPVYIAIDSDSDSESAVKPTKRDGPSLQRSTSHRATDRHGSNPEPRDLNVLVGEKTKHCQTERDSKKRGMSTVADVKPNKRVSLGDPASSNTAPGNASAGPDIPKTELRHGIESHPTTTSPTDAPNQDGPYVEESSDDDDKFKSKILAPVPSACPGQPVRAHKADDEAKSKPAPSTRPDQLDHGRKHSKKPSPRTLNHLNNTINSHNKRGTPAAQGANFFDLTGLGDDSD